MLFGKLRGNGAIVGWVALQAGLAWRAGWSWGQGCSSVGLIMCNRYLALYLHQPVLTLVCQNMTATLLSLCVWMLGIGNTMKRWQLEHFVRVVPLTVVFSLLLFTSFKTLSFVSVATVVVFRNSSPFFTAIAERTVNGTQISNKSMVILVMLIVGAVIFSYDDITFSAIGYGWGLANLTCTVVAGMFGKSFAMGLKSEQTGLGLSCYQNIVSVPTLALLAMATGEFFEWTPWYLATLFPAAQLVFGLSCCWCVTIGIATFELQRLVPQTTVTVCNVSYKLITLIVNAALFGNNVGLVGMFGLMIAQGCAVLYILERTREAQAKTELPTTRPAELSTEQLAESSDVQKTPTGTAEVLRSRPEAPTVDGDNEKEV